MSLWPVDSVYLNFIKAFDSISQSIPLKELAAPGMDRCTLCQVKNCMAGPKRGVESLWNILSWKGLTRIIKVRLLALHRAAPGIPPSACECCPNTS